MKSLNLFTLLLLITTISCTADDRVLDVDDLGVQTSCTSKFGSVMMVTGINSPFPPRDNMMAYKENCMEKKICSKKETVKLAKEEGAPNFGKDLDLCEKHIDGFLKKYR